MKNSRTGTVIPDTPPPIVTSSLYFSAWASMHTQHLHLFPKGFLRPLKPAGPACVVEQKWGRYLSWE
jgi:hypothetical protein